MEEFKNKLLDVLGKDDGSESYAGDADEDCGKEDDVAPKTLVNYKVIKKLRARKRQQDAKRLLVYSCTEV